ncbi:hypothetical protein DNHGIG_07910 [Collibacillus ludicampi]|uniref:Uncharacterized protein n=1 Tax=Collibacillus ludicampi TaxID=2771369 RepID=A0AAV4LBS2_9BACL|nr:YiiX/YebB-like N1pC/P60 family cysteine hydrolase [Collibacillus ludicampi]GIM45242.1 hypothetical protein DNHGIG_07910 [Collibacillus ludicampi]
MDLIAGDIVFVRGHDPVSRIIEDVTHGPYSHVAIYVWGDRVIEAQGFRTVGFQRLSHYEGRYDAYRVNMTDEQVNNGLRWLLKQQGRRYDYWDLVVLFLKCAFNLKIPWREGKRIICSRLGRDFLFHCGMDIPDENMTPEDLFEWVQRHGSKVSE